MSDYAALVERLRAGTDALKEVSDKNIGHYAEVPHGTPRWAKALGSPVLLIIATDLREAADAIAALDPDAPHNSWRNSEIRKLQVKVRELEQERYALRAERNRYEAERDNARTTFDALVLSAAAERDAVNEDLREFCQLVGEFDGARPETPHAVFQKCLARVRAMARVVEAARLLLRDAGHASYGDLRAALDAASEETSA